MSALANHHPVPFRRRRVSVRRETAPDVVDSVLPRGHCRPATQAQWAAVAVEAVGGRLFRADRHTTLLAVADVLKRWADWKTLTTRPTWERLIHECQQATGHGSRATIARALATLIEMQLIARVAGGRQGQYSPGTDTTNEAAVYVLLVPSPLRAVDSFETPPAFGFVSEAHPVRAREDQHQTEPLRGQPDVVAAKPPPNQACADRNVPLWPGNATAGTKGARLSAAAELQRRLPVLRQISSRDVRSCLRTWFLAGWTIDDLQHALDHRPDGTRWPHDGATGIGQRSVRGWIRYRLAAWLRDELPIASPSQQARSDRLHQLALQRHQDELATQRSGTPTTTPPPIFLAARAHLRHQNRGYQDPDCDLCQTK